MANVTFLKQVAPVDEYGRALYAASRSILRAILDSLGGDDLADLNCDRGDVTMRQLAKVARIERDKGMRGDGFEWAVHEGIVGGEPRLLEPIADVLPKASKYLKASTPSSVMFGYERAKYLGFLDAVVDTAGNDAVLLPDGRGHPYAFGPWVRIAARGQSAEDELSDRIKKIWKTDLFLTDETAARYAAATVKSNHLQLEDGPGLRIGIVPEAKDLPHGIHRRGGLWVVALPDPDGFMGLFNDAYMAVAAAITTLGKHERPPYFAKPTAKAQRVQEQLEKYPTAKVVEIEDALNAAAAQKLITVEHELVSVQPPSWLHIAERSPIIIAPKPVFAKLD